MKIRLGFLFSLVLWTLFSTSLTAFDLPQPTGDLPKPTAEVTKFQLDKISLRDATFLFELTVKNPYPVGLTFSGMDLVFSVEGNKVFSAKSEGGFTVPANGTKGNTFTVNLVYEDIIKVVKSYLSKDWLNTTIDATLTIPLPKLPGVPPDITFHYTLTKKIPAIKPSLAILNFKVKPPTQQQIADALIQAGKKTSPEKVLGAFQNLLAGKKVETQVIDPADLDVPITVSFTLSLKNQAKAPLSFDKMNYKLFVNGENLIDGASTQVVQKGENTLVTIDNVFSSQKLSKSVKALLTDRKGSFGVQGEASLKLPTEIRKDPLPLGFDEKGNFSLN